MHGSLKCCFWGLIVHEFIMKEYYEVLSEEQIFHIKEIVCDNEISRYPSEFAIYYVDNINIAFGKFIDGYCLVYVNQGQKNISEHEESSQFFASYIIDEKGDFVKLPFDKDKKLTGITEIDKDDYQIKIQRIYAKKIPTKFSTDDICNVNNELSPTSYVLYQGYYLPSFGDDSSDDIKEIYGGIIDLHSKMRLYKKDISCFINRLFNRRYMFLKWQMESKDGACETDWDIFCNHGYSEDELIDCYETRYGLFDIWKRKTLIHCDNTGLYYINGFRKIEIEGNDIYTYTYNDLKKGVGVKYSPRIKECSTTPNLLATNNATFDYECVNIIDRFNPAHSFILREGKYAGRNLLWLLIEKSQIVFKYINLNYIWFSSISDLPSCIDKDIINAIWLRMDMKKEFEPIFDADSPIYSKDCFPLCERSLYEGRTIAYVISNAYNYIYELVTKYQTPMEIDLQVFDILEERWSEDETLLEKLQNIKYEVECVKQEKESQRKEEQNWISGCYFDEEQRWYENEAY